MTAPVDERPVSAPAHGGGRGRPRDERASSAIMAAALRQLDEHGYGGVSMESVAAEAGVARATIYRRYRDKADLITAAIAGNSADHLSGEPSLTPRLHLISYLEAFDDRFGESCLEVIGTLIGARHTSDPLALHRQRVVEPRMGYLRSLLERARELGQIASPVDLDLALEMLVGSIFSRRISGIPSEPGWAHRAVDLIGIGPDAGGPDAGSPHQ